MLIINFITLVGIFFTIQNTKKPTQTKSEATLISPSPYPCKSGSCGLAAYPCCTDSQSTGYSCGGGGTKTMCARKCEYNGSLYSYGSVRNIYQGPPTGNTYCSVCTIYESSDSQMNWYPFTGVSCEAYNTSLTPGVSPIPTQPAGQATLGCGATCTNASQCSNGMSCIDIGGGSAKECWNSTTCGGGADKMVRISGRVTNCAGTQGIAGVKVRAFNNTTTTNAQGIWFLGKSGTYYGSTSILAGADATGTGFYTRVTLPIFTRPFTCANVNCNYRPPNSSTPYREAYYILYGSTYGLTNQQYDAFFKTSNNTQWVGGFNFKPTNCN